MVLMALDHNAMALHSWPHGTAVDGEYDSAPVNQWNRPLAATIRTLTHLCAPGFTFLLGMGVAYFGRSRTNMGWSAGQMIRHFVVRAVVLTMITEVIGLTMTGGQVWFFNIVLFALAVDYLIAGLLWMAVARTERSLGYLLLRVLPQKEEDERREPLLREGREEGGQDVAPDRAIIRAADVSWHLHNGLLLGLAVVTIWWNIWLSPTGGYCGVEPRWERPESVWIRLWFWPVGGSMSDKVLSGFPPMSWVSFAILGLLYGRIVLARSWSTRAINAGNAAVGAGFFLFFVLTRLLHVGNLSEGCLHMPEHVANPDGNQYLQSAASFFYVIKYPSDVAFWSLTMAGNFFLLALFGSVPPSVANRVFRVFLVYGTSALFFYVLHIVILFATGAMLLALVGHKLDSNDAWTGEPGVGVDQIWAVFGNLLFALAVLYPLCKWYGKFKRTKGPDSIWRFF
ncbi:hypothetical protein QBC34DRAFT_400764 [Podospora aff. communis PSN243]|uniref:Heparan-alpha-glucosaminide N-acetyltransferase catalytic domain-containing protein n=1 Tax=Podospora aff. communis PSN243 TaxID=3040156 RepID=A0AAV9GSG6_9PEZI|nr:hypothetical protein QBC34DRAFT_400764 [Podospora aff. communis PSN243]